MKLNLVINTVKFELKKIEKHSVKVSMAKYREDMI